MDGRELSKLAPQTRHAPPRTGAAHPVDRFTAAQNNAVPQIVQDASDHFQMPPTLSFVVATFHTPDTFRCTVHSFQTPDTLSQTLTDGGGAAP